MHALLSREWGTNVKGRDWYDMKWYIKKGYPFNLDHFRLRAIDSGDWKKDTVTEQKFRDLLAAKIDEVNMDYVRADISRFIRNPKVLNIWSFTYFYDLVTHLRVK